MWEETRDMKWVKVTLRKSKEDLKFPYCQKFSRKEKTWNFCVFAELVFTFDEIK